MILTVVVETTLYKHLVLLDQGEEQEHGDMLCATYAVKQKAPVIEALSVVTQVAKMTVTTVLRTVVVMEMTDWQCTN